MRGLYEGWENCVALNGLSLSLRVRIRVTRIIEKSHRGAVIWNKCQRIEYKREICTTNRRKHRRRAAPLAAMPQYRPRIWHARTLWLARVIVALVGVSRLARFQLPVRMYKRAYKRAVDEKLRTIHTLRDCESLITRWMPVNSLLLDKHDYCWIITCNQKSHSQKLNIFVILLL